MVVAYIMVKVNTGEADRIKSELEALEGVVDVHIVAGDVDFIVKVDAESPGDVKSVSTTALQEIAGVEDTQTYMAMG
ncbi:Lrp/AsnC family C-terminal domain [Halalkaliarchaeum sp. AArc-CO]|uniref:Lrp/AsnC family transcriptional regulator n=1 Tax=unclassified Halalkaliarchaeum TaxID=2678344 RepID=UPI00217F1918|nr:MULTISPECIES: Lrp/AsnC ligand binding domain-containing protein [unclassified Halalkaliarchaeum]MDR5673522.1 Lrp/AsnC ligand binding domain-containing protein [Halalkaliarchaeum sp. AArc-GB]UWG49792.1 Lrp/AsnC family C-terminal domain [Halalkaliarchaeum sp. AArc-CO]